MKTPLLKAFALSTAFWAGSTALAATVGITASDPLSGYALGGNQYATLLDVRSSTPLVGQTIALNNLNAAILSGTVSGFYYAAGNSSSANFGAGAIPFSPFVSGVVQAGSGQPNVLLNSLFAVHSAPVTFSNGTSNGGTSNGGTSNGGTSNGGTSNGGTSSSAGSTSGSNNSSNSNGGGTSTITTGGSRLEANPFISLQQDLVTPNSVPDNGIAVGLLGIALAALALLRRKFAA